MRCHTVAANTVSFDFHCSVLHVGTRGGTCTLRVYKRAPVWNVLLSSLWLMLKDVFETLYTRWTWKRIDSSIWCSFSTAGLGVSHGQDILQSISCFKLLVVRGKVVNSQGKGLSFYEHVHEVEHPLEHWAEASNSNGIEPWSFWSLGIWTSHSPSTTRSLGLCKSNRPAISRWSWPAFQAGAAVGSGVHCWPLTQSTLGCPWHNLLSLCITVSCSNSGSLSPWTMPEISSEQVHLRALVGAR